MGKSPWDLRNLGDCLTFISRGVAPKYVTKSSIAVLNQKSIRWGYIQSENLKFHDPNKPVKRDIFIQKGDIVINSTGDITIGRAYYFKNKWNNLFVDSHVTILRLNHEILLPEFLIYLFPLPEYQKKIYGLVTGATGQLEFSRTNLQKLDVEVPPLPIQRKIAAILSAYDDLIENNTRRIRILEEMAQAIYREWFVHFRYPGYEGVRMVESSMGLIPEGWEIASFSDLVEIDPPTQVDKEIEKPYIDMGGLSINSMVIQWDEWRVGINGSKFQNEDVLFPRITPSVENGKGGFVQCLPKGMKGIGSTEFIVFRKKYFPSEYIYFLSRDDKFRENATKSMIGASGRQRVQKDCFGNFYLPSPPPELLRKFTEFVLPIFRFIQVLSEKYNNLRIQRDLLLPKLLSGEIVFDTNKS
ncbi:MAG: restriction endonuclease subunit S, partial [Planctomycetes bacterium]|nr:restriction endonuclease subunit S [Planctomycetota bacterium]